jgi:thiol-disulfide isomerase/thioredoxin
MSKSPWIPTVLVAAILAMTGCATDEQGADVASTAESAPASTDASTPDPGPFSFTAATVDGGTLDGESLKHRDVVLWFWAPWCPTCMVEGKDHVAAAIAQMPADVEFIGIAGRSDDRAAMEEFLEWTGTGNATHVMDIDGSIWEGFGVVLQPAFYFVNDDGTAHKAGAGLTTEDIMAEVEWLQES